ncbi:serine hydrolase [Plantactinospora sonchi]|uniref:Serine hydrolase n=1 Tax=Plantactinospora sonchi TaxID=1544735 RepID=A0ABU7RNI5_9ACTN
MSPSPSRKTTSLAGLWRYGVLLVVTALIGFLCPPGLASAAPVLDGAAVDRFMADHLESTGLPGAAIAITHRDQVVYLRGYGHNSAGDRVTADSLFPVGSVSKSFTALAVMQLVDAGRLELDTPVQRYLPDFAPRGSRSASITVRQLLNQTSGLSDQTFPDARGPQPASLQESVTRLRSAEPATAPGESWSYYNPHYHVAARLVEVVAQTPFTDYLNRHVFGPLKMASSVTLNNTRDLHGVPKGYAYVYGRAVARSEPAQFVNGSHGVVSTAHDMAQWLVLHNNRGKSMDGAQVVSPQAIDALHTPPKPEPGYAMGWFANTDDGRNELTHDGAWFTFTANQTLLPETGYGIAVLANVGIGLGVSDTSVITEGLITLIEGGTPQPGSKSTLVVHLVLAGMTLLTIAAGVRGALRSRLWARHRSNRPIWRLCLRLLPYGIPLVVLWWLPPIVDAVFNGPAITWPQIMVGGIPLVVWIVSGVVMSVAVVGLRCVALLRLRAGAPDPAQPKHT